jgi:hypothetical protein
MTDRAPIALLLSSLLAVGALGAGIDLFANRDCPPSGNCSDDTTAWVLGLPLAVLGVAMLIGAAVAWKTNPRVGAQIAALVWAAVLLALGAALGGAANALGIVLAVLAVVMGAISVWVDR